MATAELKVRIDAETGQLKQGLDKAKNDIANFDKSATNSVNKFGSNATSVFKVAAASIAGALSVGAFVNFGREVLSATAQFEKFGAVLGNTLGSKALADLKLKEIQEFAAKTPFGVNELTNSFVKLANQGFKPTGDQMRLLGDLASSTGKSFDQLAEAIIDAQVGEFERLKEFGIRAQDAGDKVIFTFKGVQTTVDKSSESIRGYITSLGNAEGVSGSMAVISATLTGKISNLGDSWDQMLISVGSNTSGVFSGAIDLISDAINGITRFNKELEIQSKFKIGGGFLNRLTTSTEFDSEEVFNNKKAIDSIISLDEELTKFLSGVITGAKSMSDFGDAIAKIKSEGDKKLKDTSILGPEAVAGIKETYQNAIKALQDGRKAFQAELNTPKGANFGKGKGAGEKSQSDVLKQLEIDLQKVANAVDITFGKGNEQKIAAFAKAIDGITEIGGDRSIIQRLQQDILNLDQSALKLTGKSVGVTLSAGIEQGLASSAPVIAKDLSTKLKGGLTEWQTYVNNDLLPKVQQNFETFFNEILIRGKFSFDALGKAILNTLLSVVASDAARSVANLFTIPEKGVGKKDVGGIFGATGIIGSLFAKKAIVGGVAAGAAGTAAVAGGAAAAGTAAAGTAAVAGTAAAGGTAGLAAGTAATGGALLPILAGIAAVAGIASLLKKRKVEPQPAFTTSNAISTSSSSNVDFGNGRVVFEISGVNLVGVLNRAGAKLQRFGP